jgi:hypothetical protein
MITTGIGTLVLPITLTKDSGMEVAGQEIFGVVGLVIIIKMLIIGIVQEVIIGIMEQFILNKRLCQEILN